MKKNDTTMNKTKAVQKLFKKFILITAAIHIPVKIIIYSYGAVGLPLVLIGVLLYYMYKHKRWAKIGYYILSTLFMTSGMYGIVLLCSEIYHNTLTALSLLLILVTILHK